MLITTRHPLLSLEDDQVARLTQAHDTRIEVVDGTVWLTVDGDSRDVVLAAGQSYLVGRPENITVSALRGAAALKVHDNHGRIAA